MFRKIFSNITLVIHLVLILAPFALIAYHVYNFLNNEEVLAIPLIHAFYDWFGIDLMLQNVPIRFEGLYNIYVVLVRLPLLFWLFIFAIPSFIGIYRRVK